MQVSRKLEQHIAVFGESGSGKTVLLSSFYGAMQESQYLRAHPFNVVSDDIGQGARLQRNYLGMRDSAKLPAPTKFAATSYSFSVKLKDGGAPRAARERPFDSVRLVWHDYPGEWFEQDVSGPEEGRRRVDTFKSLLGSDVALLLVDGQRLLDNAGEEERYLKSLIGNFRNGLLTLKDDLLDEGKPLVDFPRIWILALSKADLLPQLTVFNFRDLLIEKICDELDELRSVLGSLIESSDALSVGEDFLLLSSARFDPDRIVVADRKGVELTLPLAAILPFERHAKWVKTKQIRGKVAENLLRGGAALAAALLNKKRKDSGFFGKVVQYFGPSVVEEAETLVGDQLGKVNEAAKLKHESMQEMLTGFKLQLDEGEVKEILLRSPR